MEIVYLLCQGDFTKMGGSKKILWYTWHWGLMEWDLDRFLYQGQYLLQKRYVEGLK